MGCGCGQKVCGVEGKAGAQTYAVADADADRHNLAQPCPHPVERALYRDILSVMRFWIGTLLSALLEQSQLLVVTGNTDDSSIYSTSASRDGWTCIY